MSSVFDNKWHSSDPGGSEAMVIQLVISYAIVAIRLYCKVVKNPSRPAIQNLSWDDFFIVLALASCTVRQGVVFWGLSKGGSGLLLPILVKEGHYDGVRDFLLANFVAMLMDIITLTLIRLSILSFYRAIFGVYEWFVLASIVIAFVTIVWTIVCVFATIFMCTPVDHFWKPLGHGTCHRFQLFYVIVGSFETAMDAAILALPIAPVLQLHKPLRTRLYIVGIFLLGAFVIFTNILRLKFIYQPHTNYVDLRKVTLWISIHITSAFACACLPLCKEVVLKLGEGTNTVLHYTRWLRLNDRSSSGGAGSGRWRKAKTSQNQEEGSSANSSFQLGEQHSTASSRLDEAKDKYET